MVGVGLLAAAAVPELFKIGKGIAYGAQSRKYAQKQRPAYEIPQAVKDYLAQTKFNAGTYGLPGQGQIENKLGRQTAASTRAIQQSGQSSASQLGALAALDQQSKETIADLGVEAADFRADQQQDMYRAQRAMAAEQKKQWEWDKQDPYLNAMEKASELQEAGTGAVFTGLEGLSGIALSGMMMGKQGGWFGSGGKAATTGLTDPALLGIKPIMAPEYAADDERNLSGAYDFAGQYELPPSLTNAFNRQYYGTDINDEMSDYYNLGGGFNQLFNNIFRRRGSERTRTYRR